jgi:hypothetical protein
MITQQERKIRGTVFEDLVIEELEGRGCRIAQRFQGRETKEAKPDIYAFCNGELSRIEVKVALAWQKDGERIRPGRFLMSPSVAPKDCYAFGIDDQVDETLSIDYVKAKKPDTFIRKHGEFPKYPITELVKMRDRNRCFTGVGTIVRPRAELDDRVRERIGQ